MNKYSFPTDKDQKEIQKYVLRINNKNKSALQENSLNWVRTSWENKMDYEITWLGIPIIQNPYDIVLMQELVFNVKPTIIVESGIAHGGSLIFYASMLKLLGKGKVIGIDIDIREHNKKLILKHPLSKTIDLIEGNSISEDIIKRVKHKIKNNDKVLIILDSNHEYNHVYNELNAYKELISLRSYVVVFDTFMPKLQGLSGASKDVKINNPLTAVRKFISENKNFVIDKYYNKFYVSSCPDGFIKRIS